LGVPSLTIPMVGGTVLTSMEMIRIRLKEALAERGMTPYALSRKSKGVISMSAVYRLMARDGVVRFLDMSFLDAAATVLECEPGSLLEKVPGKVKRKKRTTAAA
jgi:DNA-binding Xre family transcriptional regulator